MVIDKNIAICSAGELFGGVEQWIVSFVDRVKGQGARGQAHSEQGPGSRGQEHFEQGPGSRGQGQALRGSESFDQNVAGPMTPDPGAFNLDFIVVLFWDGELARRLREIGVQPIIVETKGTYDLGVFKRLRKVLKDNQVGIVHTHGFKADVLCGIAAIQLGIPRVKTQHGAVESKDAFSIPSLRMRMNIVLSRLFEPFFDRIIFVTKDLLQKRFIKSKKMSVIHNAIPVIPEGNKRPLEPKDAFKIGIIGRISRVKGHKYLIKALAGLPAQCHVYIFGEGSLKGELLQYAHQCGVVERVHFMGFQRDIHTYMRALDVFAMPSLHEGLPYTLLDAMYLRVPVVASRVGGLAEVLRESKDALLIEPKDADALRNALLHFYNDRDFARHLASNAYEKVTKEFMIENMVNNYVKVYDTVLKGDV
jgi:glycosyltransferase involved in cell wall biosynthesis